MLIHTRFRNIFQIWNKEKSLKGCIARFFSFFEKFSHSLQQEETTAGLQQFQQSVNGTFYGICHKTFFCVPSACSYLYGPLGRMISKVSKLVLQLTLYGMKIFLVVKSEIFSKFQF